jgi:hypothetical protein
MKSVCVFRSESRSVKSPDAGSNVTFLSIRSFPMVQLWEKALEARSNNTSPAKELILMESSPANSTPTEETL